MHTPRATKEHISKLEALVRSRHRPEPPKDAEVEKAHRQEEQRDMDPIVAAGRRTHHLLSNHKFTEIGKVAEELSRMPTSGQTVVRNLFLKHTAALVSRQRSAPPHALKEAVRVFQEWYNQTAEPDKRTCLFTLILAKILNEIRVERRICDEVPPLVIGDECLPLFEDERGLQVEPLHLYISSIAHGRPETLAEFSNQLAERGDGCVERVDWDGAAVALSSNSTHLHDFLSSAKPTLSDGALLQCMQASSGAAPMPSLAQALAETAERGRDLKDISLETWTALCLFHGSNQHMPGVLDTLRKMKKHYSPGQYWSGKYERVRGSTQLSFSACQSIASRVFSSVEDVDNAYFELEKRMKDGEDLPDEAIAIIIAGCGKQGSLERAYDTFDVLEELGFTKSIRSFNALLSACVDLKERNNAENVLSDLREAGLQPDQSTFHLLVRLYCEDDQPNMSIVDGVTRQALDDRVRLTTATMKLIADTAIDVGDYRLARVVTDRLNTGNTNCSLLRGRLNAAVEASQ